jgi:hypothetical protein
MEKSEITQELVLETTQIFVVVTQKFPTQARIQHKSDYENKNYKSASCFPC